MNIDTIAVEGISGIGKSNLGHYLSLKYTELGVPNRWYFELDSDNPLIPNNHDSNIIPESADLLQQYFKKERIQKQVNIFDGRLFMINVGKSLKSGLTNRQIIERMKPVIELINEHNVYMFMFYTRDIPKLLQNTIEQRDCLEWYLNSLETTDIERFIDYTKQQQDIMLELFDYIHTHKSLMDLTKLNWNKRYQEIDNLLGFNRTEDSDNNLSHLTGVYKNRSAEESYVIEHKNNLLQCSTHPYQKYKPVEQIFKLHPIERDIFAAKGHPIKITFSRNSNSEIDGLYEHGLTKDENFMGIIKDKFIKV